MSETLQNGILAELGDSGVQQIAGLLGTDPDTARQAVDSALPAIVGGLAKNTQDPQGADDLYKALGDHTEANPTADIAALGGGTDGGAILGHALGGNLDSVTGALSDRTGLPADKIKQAAVILAPIVMSFLAKKVMGGQQDAGGVAQDLQNEQPSGGLGDLLGQLLGR